MHFSNKKTALKCTSFKGDPIGVVNQKRAVPTIDQL
jgi:hypothetical protein